MGRRSGDRADFQTPGKTDSDTPHGKFRQKITKPTAPPADSDKNGRFRQEHLSENSDLCSRLGCLWVSKKMDPQDHFLRHLFSFFWDICFFLAVSWLMRRGQCGESSQAWMNPCRRRKAPANCRLLYVFPLSVSFVSVFVRVWTFFFKLSFFGVCSTPHSPRCFLSFAFLFLCMSHGTVRHPLRERQGQINEWCRMDESFTASFATQVAPSCRAAAVVAYVGLSYLCCTGGRRREGGHRGAVHRISAVSWRARLSLMFFAQRFHNLCSLADVIQNVSK